MVFPMTVMLKTALKTPALLGINKDKPGKMTYLVAETSSLYYYKNVS